MKNPQDNTKQTDKESTPGQQANPVIPNNRAPNEEELRAIDNQ